MLNFKFLFGQILVTCEYFLDENDEEIWKILIH